jgi:hypothetical protein
MRRLLIILSVFLVPIAAQAALVTFEFTGTVHTDFGFGVGVGTAVTGSYTFESDTPGLSIPGAALYSDALTELRADFGGNTFLISNPDPGSAAISVFDDDPTTGDVYSAGALEAGLLDGSGASILLVDPSGGMLSGTALPTSPPVLPSTADLLIQTGLRSETKTLGVRLESLRLPSGGSAPIPEPTSVLLLGAGGLIVGGAVRRRK